VELKRDPPSLLQHCCWRGARCHHVLCAHRSDGPTGQRPAKAPRRRSRIASGPLSYPHQSDLGVDSHMTEGTVDAIANGPFPDSGRASADHTMFASNRSAWHLLSDSSWMPFNPTADRWLSNLWTHRQLTVARFVRRARNPLPAEVNAGMASADEFPRR
jgi:hypothetical protein